MRFLVLAFVEDKLRNAVTISQVNENQPAQIASPMNPTHEGGCFPYIAGPQVPAAMGTAQFAEKI
jgi:hypothetical protein